MTDLMGRYVGTGGCVIISGTSFLLPRVMTRHAHIEIGHFLLKLASQDKRLGQLNKDTYFQCHTIPSNFPQAVRLLISSSALHKTLCWLESNQVTGRKVTISIIQKQPVISLMLSTVNVDHVKASVLICVCFITSWKFLEVHLNNAVAPPLCDSELLTLS